MKRLLCLAVAVMLIFTFAGCNKKTSEAVQEKSGANTENKADESSVALNYSITKESMEVADSNTKIFYPQVKDFPGELLMDYMNQSLSKILDIYTDKDTYTDVKIDYEITKMEDKILSVLFKGTGKLKGGREINIQKSVNLDMKTSNEIVYDNYIKSDEKSREEVRKILDQKAKEAGQAGGLEAEGIFLYFKGDNVVFFYMPLDDSAKEWIELDVPSKELDGYVNTDFGEAPAS